MLRHTFTFLRPGGGRSWRSRGATAATAASAEKIPSARHHFAKTQERLGKTQTVLPGTVSGTGKKIMTDEELHAQAVAEEKQHYEQQQQQQRSDTRSAASIGFLTGVWHSINPSKNIERFEKNRILRRGLYWARAIKLSQFAHISYYLGPAYVGTGFACTVAVVREGCDAVALQLPFIPLHLSTLNIGALWSVTACGYLLQAFVRKRFFKDTTVQIGTFDAVGAFIMHAISFAVLLLWQHWACVSVAMISSPIVLLALALRLKAFQAVANEVTTTTKEQQKAKHQQQQNTNTPIIETTTRPQILVESAVTAVPLLMGYASVLGRIDPIVCAPLAAAGFCWGAMHYSFCGGSALVLRSATIDDRKLIKLQLLILAFLSYSCVNVAGLMAGQTLFFYAALAWSGWHMLRVVDHFRPGDAWSIATAQKRLRSSVWLVFLSVMIGNLLWLLLVGVIAATNETLEKQQPPKEVEEAQAKTETDAKTEEKKAEAQDQEEKFELVERGADLGEKQTTKPTSRLATMLTLTVKPAEHKAITDFSWMARTVKPVLVYATVHQHPHATSDDLRGLEIPVAYRREFLGENVSYLMAASGLFTKEQMERFEHVYLSLLDHYSPTGNL